MIYKEWMKYIKDDVAINKVIMPGAHNAGSYGLFAMGCCQDGTLYDQFAYGVRHFCIRFCKDKKHGAVLCHGLSKGAPLVEGLKSIKRMLEENDSEFFIFDFREYYPQDFGPITVDYSVDDKLIADMLEEYISPSKYAFADFDKIGDVTMGDLRKSGKRYILLNYRCAYPYSRDCNQIFPWEKEVNGAKAEKFVAQTLRFFDDYRTDGIYWFQTQQTPNPGTEIGLTTPRKLDKALRPYFGKLIEGIAENPFYLESANVISGDFMTEDYMKSREILRLNLLKGTVKDELRAEYEKGIG